MPHCNRRGDVDAAITFAQQHLAAYRDPALLQRHVCHSQLSIKEAQAFLEEVVALIAYPDPATCACGWILGQPQRERVADIANRAVLDALVRVLRSFEVTCHHATYIRCTEKKMKATAMQPATARRRSRQRPVRVRHLGYA